MRDSDIYLQFCTSHLNIDNYHLALTYCGYCGKMAPPIFEHFHEPKSGSTGKAVKLKCKHCDRPVHVSGFYGTSSNFHTHMKVSDTHDK